jgi:hypothetical protein
MRFCLTLVITLTIIITVGCNTGPKLKNKMAYLNNDSYGGYVGPVASGGVPLIVKTVKRESIIEGSVQGKGITGLPLRDVRVVLRDKNKKILKEIRTDDSGKFSFQEQLENGDYILEFDHKKSVQKRMVPLKGYKAKVLKVYFD